MQCTGAGLHSKPRGSPLLPRREALSRGHRQGRRGCQIGPCRGGCERASSCRTQWRSVVEGVGMGVGGRGGRALQWSQFTNDRPTVVQFVNVVAPAAQHGHDTWFDSTEPSAQKKPELRRVRGVCRNIDKTHRKEKAKLSLAYTCTVLSTLKSRDTTRRHMSQKGTEAVQLCREGSRIPRCKGAHAKGGGKGAMEDRSIPRACSVQH